MPLAVPMDELDLDGLAEDQPIKSDFGGEGADDDLYLPQDDYMGDPMGLDQYVDQDYDQHLHPDYMLQDESGDPRVTETGWNDDAFGPSTSAAISTGSGDQHQQLQQNDDHLFNNGGDQGYEPLISGDFGDDDENEEFEASNSPMKKATAQTIMKAATISLDLPIKLEPADEESTTHPIPAVHESENTEQSATTTTENSTNNNAENASKTTNDQQSSITSTTTTTTTTPTNTTSTPSEPTTPLRGSYECTVCQRTFSRRVALEQHQQTAHGYGESEDDPTAHLASGRSARIAAAAAAYDSSSTQSYRHSLPSTFTTSPRGSHPHQCPHCRKIIRSRGALTNHIRSHQRRSFACGRCETGPFADAQQLKAHIDLAHPSERPGFNLSQEGSSQAFENTSSSFPSESCRYCGEAFPGQPEALANHMRTVHPGGANDPCDCPHCGQQLKNKYRLEEHITRRHSNYRPFRCDYDGCERAFVTNTELKVHVRVHTGERPYVCHMCGFGFTVHSNLVKHLKKQHRVDWAGKRGGARVSLTPRFAGAAGITTPNSAPVSARPMTASVTTASNLAAARAASATFKAQIKNLTRSLPPDQRTGPVKCPQCPAIIRSKYSLEDHMKRRHSNIRPHKCAHCPRRFVSASELVIHNRVHTGERPFSCEICHAGFTTKSSLVKHCRCMHGKDIRSFMKAPRVHSLTSGSNSTSNPQNSGTGNFRRTHFMNEVRAPQASVPFQGNRVSILSRSSPAEAQNSFEQTQNSPVTLNQHGEEEVLVDEKPPIFFCPYCPRGSLSQYHHQVHLRSHPEYQEEMRRKRAMESENGGQNQNQQNRQVQENSSNDFNNRNNNKGGSGNNGSGYQCDHCSMSFILQQDLMRHQQLTHRYHPSNNNQNNDNGGAVEDDGEEDDDENYIHIEPQVSFNEGDEGGDVIEENEENDAVDGGGGGFEEEDHLNGGDQFEEDQQQENHQQQEDLQENPQNNHRMEVKESDKEDEVQHSAMQDQGDPQRPFQCHECPECFADETAFEDHQVTHLFHVSYSCRVCGQAMEGKQELVSHMKIHYGSGRIKNPIPVKDSKLQQLQQQQNSRDSSAQPSPQTSARSSPAPVATSTPTTSNPAIRIRILNGSSGVNATSTRIISSTNSPSNSATQTFQQRPVPQSLSAHFSLPQQRFSPQQSQSQLSSQPSTSSSLSSRPGLNSSGRPLVHQCPVCRRRFDKKGSLTNHLKAHQSENMTEKMRAQPKIKIREPPPLPSQQQGPAGSSRSPKLACACNLCEKSFHHPSTLKTHLLFSHNIVEGAVASAAVASNAGRQLQRSLPNTNVQRTSVNSNSNFSNSNSNSFMGNGFGGQRHQQQFKTSRPPQVQMSTVRGGYNNPSLLPAARTSNGLNHQQQQRSSFRPSMGISSNGRSVTSTFQQRQPSLHSSQANGGQQQNGQPSPEKVTPFHCHLCDRSFTAQRYLTNHVKSHRTNEELEAEAARQLQRQQKNQMNGFYKIEEGGEGAEDELRTLNMAMTMEEGEGEEGMLEGWMDADEEGGYHQQQMMQMQMQEGEEYADGELMNDGMMGDDDGSGGGGQMMTGEEHGEEDTSYQEYPDDDGMLTMDQNGWEEGESYDQVEGGGENEDDIVELPPCKTSFNGSNGSNNNSGNFPNNSHLNRLLSSNVVNSHPCPHCDKAFSSRANLIIHIRVHTGERPYRCSVCKVAFTSSSHFYRHQRSAAHARVVAGTHPASHWQY